VAVVAMLLLGMGLTQPTHAETRKQYEPTWKSIDSRPVPEWFADAKFGIFIHWGVYSVPAWGPKGSYAEWYLAGLRSPRSSRRAFQARVYGPDFKYKDFAPMFKAELWDPDQWAEFFARAGAKYVIITSKHHEGFCLWPSPYRPGWNAMDIGPKRDLLGDLTTAVRRKHLKMGFYYSLMDWNHPDYPDHLDQYVNQYMIPEIKDLVLRYKPDILWGDGEWDHPAEVWKTKQLLAWIFNEAPNGNQIAVNDRWGGGIRLHHGGYFTTEYGSGLYDAKRPWEETRGMGASFGYNRNETIDEYQSAEHLVRLLADLVSRGGNLLLNIGPTADGRIPVIMQERLVQIGDWLKVNGEGIYATRPWSVKTGEYEKAHMARIDPVIRFPWRNGSPGGDIKANGFHVTWTGYLQADKTGDYTLHTISDDGVRLWIDGAKVIDNFSNHAPTEDTAHVHLEAGRKRALKIEYFEDTGGATMMLLWSGKNLRKQIIPQKNLFSSLNQSAGDGLKGEYTSMKEPEIVYTSKGSNVYAFALRWPGKNLVLHIPKPAEGTKVTMLGLEGNLPWSYDHDSMVIDLSRVGLNNLPCRWAWGFRLAK